MIRVLLSEKILNITISNRSSQAGLRLRYAAALLVLGCTAMERSAAAAGPACLPDAGQSHRRAVGLVLSGGGARIGPRAAEMQPAPFAVSEGIEFLRGRIHGQGHRMRMRESGHGTP